MTTVSGGTAVTPLSVTEAPADPTMALLRAGVPLSLLLDLAWAPDSVEVSRLEGGEATWLRPSA